MTLRLVVKRIPPSEMANIKEHKMKITKTQLRKIIKEEAQNLMKESVSLRDFQPGVRVTWNTMERVERETPSGRIKVDFERVPHAGSIISVDRGGYGLEAVVSVQEDGQSGPQEIEAAELTLA
jgi:hypothetical protein